MCTHFSIRICTTPISVLLQYHRVEDKDCTYSLYSISTRTYGIVSPHSSGRRNRYYRSSYAFCTHQPVVLDNKRSTIERESGTYTLILYTEPKIFLPALFCPLPIEVVISMMHWKEATSLAVNHHGIDQIPVIQKFCTRGKRKQIRS